MYVRITHSSLHTCRSVCRAACRSHRVPVTLKFLPQRVKHPQHGQTTLCLKGLKHSRLEGARGEEGGTGRDQLGLPPSHAPAALPAPEEGRRPPSARCRRGAVAQFLSARPARPCAAVTLVLGSPTNGNDRPHALGPAMRASSGCLGGAHGGALLRPWLPREDVSGQPTGHAGRAVNNEISLMPRPLGRASLSLRDYCC